MCKAETHFRLHWQLALAGVIAILGAAAFCKVDDLDLCDGDDGGDDGEAS